MLLLYSEVFDWTKIWVCLSTLGLLTVWGIEILQLWIFLCLHSSAYQHAFLCQPRGGITGSWNMHLCICPVFQMVLRLCQHLVVSYFVLLQNEGVYLYLFVVLFCFSLFTSKVDPFFMFVVTWISPFVWSGSFFHHVVYLFNCLQNSYTFRIQVFCWLYM